ncbi:MAG: DUF456 domain-containing protein [Bacteroidales bacterium]|nr:DUF456 domain-containing protein [Bacteroidales bacterium]
MDIFLAITGTICIITGVLGSLLPVLPGPPISYAGILLLHFSSYAQYDTRFLILFAALTAVVAVLDYVIPVWGTKKFGGSKYGTWGAAIGVVIGLFFGPLGIIVGPFLGAVIGEILYGKKSNEAFRAGFGSFVGFVTGTLMKIVLSIVLAFHFFKALGGAIF